MQYIIILLMLIFPCTAFGSPTSITGNTVIGSGFVEKSPAAPLLWDSFESGIDGTKGGND